MSYLNWSDLVAKACASPRHVIRAVSFQGRRWETSRRPALLGCADGFDYVVKGPQEGRTNSVEQIVAHLAHIINAPVPPTNLVDVSAALSVQDPHLEDLAGIGHGSRYIVGSTERGWIQHQGIRENKRRFTSLAILYGWVFVGDHQLIYDSSRRVYSIDHGHCFYGGPGWTINDLRSAPEAAPFQPIVERCAILRADLRRFTPTLESISAKDIASAVAASPEEWGLSFNERLHIASYLERRRQQMLAHLSV